MTDNPLLSPFDIPPFDRIGTEHFLPAFEASIRSHRAEIQAIKDGRESPQFSNAVEALEQSGRQLGEVSSIFFNLRSAESNDEIQEIARKVSPLLTEHDNSINTDKELFQKIENRLPAKRAARSFPGAGDPAGGSIPLLRAQWGAARS